MPNTAQVNVTLLNRVDVGCKAGRSQFNTLLDKQWELVYLRMVFHGEYGT
jgi:hypothetical protein